MREFREGANLKKKMHLGRSYDLLSAVNDATSTRE